MKTPWQLSGAPRVPPHPRVKHTPQTFGPCRHCGQERHAVHRCPLDPQLLELMAHELTRPLRIHIGATGKGDL